MTRIRYVGSGGKKSTDERAGKRPPVSRLVWALAAVILAGLGSIGLLRCELSEIRVQGASLVDRGTIAALVEPQLGNSLLLIDTEALRRTLREDPWVVDVVIHRRLPGTMRVVVRAAQPCMGMDDGRAIASNGAILPARPDVDLSALPRLELREGQLDALAASGSLQRFCTALSRSPWPFDDPLESIRLRGQDWMLRDAAGIHYAVGRDDFPRRLQRLAIARDRFAARAGDCVDVRFERQILLVPAVAGGQGG